MTNTNINSRLYSILKSKGIIVGGRLCLPEGKSHHSIIEVDGQRCTYLQLALATKTGSIDPESKPILSIDDPRALDIAFVQDSRNTYLSTGYIDGKEVDVMAMKYE